MKPPPRHFVLPDCQVKPDVPLEHLRWAGQYVAEKRPDVIVCLGDFADMSSLSEYDRGKKSYEGRRYTKDLDAAHRGLQNFWEPIRKQRAYKPRSVITLGNHEHRIERACDSDPRLDGTLSIGDLQYKEFGFGEVYDFLQPVVIDGIHYAHYFPSGIMGRPCTSARKIITTYHVSCVAGHQQGRDVAYAKRGDGKMLTAIIAGSFYQHNEDYLSPFTNQHWRGVVMLNEVHDGQSDEMFVSLAYLKRKFG